MSSHHILQYTETEAIILDSMADGQWHPSKKIWSNIQDSLKEKNPDFTKDDLLSIMDGFVSKNIMLSGSNQSYRFLTKELESWRLLSPTLDRDNQQMKPRYFGGVLEDDGWAHAPLKDCHLVHFKANSSLTKQFLVDHVNEPANMINLNEDGLYKIYSSNRNVGAETGEYPVYDMIQKLKENHPEYNISGIRLEPNLKRRALDDLPSRYLSDMCKHYGQFAKVLLRSRISSIEKHLPDKEDAQQQIYLWVIEAIKRYDDNTSIPFAAYLGTNLSKWVYDLSRQAYGRSIADKELKHSRAMNKFRADNERNPTTNELAEMLNMNIDDVNKEREDINTVVNLRNQKAIEYEDYELPLPAEENTETNLDDVIQMNILSSTITTASKLPSGKRNLTGLVALYYTTWGVGEDNKRIKSWLRSKNTVAALDNINTNARTIVERIRHEEDKR